MEVEIAFATDELVRRLEGAIDAFAVGWLEGHAAGDNPAEILLERFGDVVAAATPGRPDLDFMNRIHVGYLANASTLPAFRRRGCQTALSRDASPTRPLLAATSSLR